MIQGIRRRLTDVEAGFTLVELLLVIVILGILSAVVVFSVGGIDDRGEQSACRTDAQTLRTAEEAYYAKNRRYGTEAELLAASLIVRESSYHNLQNVTDSGYTVVVADARCGAVGSPA